MRSDCNSGAFVEDSLDSDLVKQLDEVRGEYLTKMSQLRKHYGAKMFAILQKLNQMSEE